jgi:hypothetical protein
LAGWVLVQVGKTHNLNGAGPSLGRDRESQTPASKRHDGSDPQGWLRPMHRYMVRGKVGNAPSALVASLKSGGASTTAPQNAIAGMPINE